MYKQKASVYPYYIHAIIIPFPSTAYTYVYFLAGTVYGDGEMAGYFTSFPHHQHTLYSFL